MQILYSVYIRHCANFPSASGDFPIIYKKCQFSKLLLIFYYFNYFYNIKNTLHPDLLFHGKSERWDEYNI